MDGAKITITINPRMIERIIYWLIIVLLLALLIASYLRNDAGTATPSVSVAEATTTITQAETLLTGLAESDAALLRTEINALQTLIDDEADDAEIDRQIGITRTLMTSLEQEEETASAPSPTATCSDGVKNQGETAVDCGGPCTGCAIGQACKAATDCIADYCTAGKCSSTAPQQLSGNVALSITKVETETNPTTGAVKVKRIDYKIENGKDKDLGTVFVKVFLKSKKSADYCLNQLYSERGECNTAYTTFTETGPRIGKTQSYTGNIEGTYLSNIDASMYDHGDDFNAWLYLYDLNGNEIDGKAIAAFKTVNP